MNSIESPLSLYSLNSLVRSAISDALPLRYWVTGELSEVRETPVGHCYIELVQHDEETQEIVAKARGTIWSRTYSLTALCRRPKGAVASIGQFPRTVWLHP